jgi:rhodanese-related sulfurtransferase
MKSLKLTLLIFLTVGVNLVSSCKPSPSDDSSLLTPEELVSKQAELTIIDVRTPAEFEGGHLENAININLYGPDFKAKLETLDKSKAVSVYCKVGGRSAKAAEVMREMGFEEVYDLEGGIRNWKKQGKKIVK